MHYSQVKGIVGQLIPTLDYLIITQYGISAQGRVFFEKQINAQGCYSAAHYYGVRPHRAGFFMEINKRTVCVYQLVQSTCSSFMCIRKLNILHIRFYLIALAMDDSIDGWRTWQVGSRVDMVGTNPDKVLTLGRHMLMGKFRTNIFLIRLTSTYFWASAVFKNQSFKLIIFIFTPKKYLKLKS